MANTNIRNYIKEKRGKHDYCNICGMVKDLTWDHVPPKAVQYRPSVYANILFNGIPTENNHMKHYQSGIKYRTICQECNNDVLGRNDNEYKDFIKQVCSMLVAADSNGQGIEPNDKIVVRTKINRVLRAVAGHFLAMKSVYDDQVLSDIYLREYVLNEKLIFNKFFLYSWFYPYSTVLNSRDFVVVGHSENTHPKGFISVMASHPLGILLSSEQENLCGLDDLGKFTTSNIDEEIDIELNFNTALLAGKSQMKNFYGQLIYQMMSMELCW